MKLNFREFSFATRPKHLLYIIITALLSSCVKEKQYDNNTLKRQFFIVDSLVIAGKSDSAMRLLTKLRPGIKTTDPLICEYYRFRAEQSVYNGQSMDIFADSALRFFDNKENLKYTDEYFKTLLEKGDASMRAKKYILALDYYDKARTLLTDGSCDDGLLAIKIAGIYYNQKNYKLAAKYWAENYHRLGRCDETITAEKLFNMKQGALNNAGFAYALDGQLDSAERYYMEDVKCIDKADSDNVIDKYYLRSSRIIVFDNLGGLNLKKGNYALADKYLTQSLSIPTTDVDGMRIPPNIKLAELSIIKGDYPRAVEAFNKSRALLNRYSKQNIESEIRWNKDYADYLAKINQPDKAYQYLKIYVRLKDSVDSSISKISKLDVERELSALHQKQTLTELKQHDKLKQICLVGATSLVIFLLVIVLLVMRNLKRAKNDHRHISLYNDQLKNTLAELERANKSYIRIMRVMAHDLKNPLWGITGLASMLLDDEEFSDDSRNMLKLIESTGTHTMEMINELLKSGLADENEPIQTEVINLKNLLFDSVELLQFKAREKNQVIEFESSDEQIMAAVNHEKIWRVFNNLIVNAIKFSHEEGIIHVAIKQDSRHVYISVADNGIGIPNENKYSIFEMFTPNKRVGTRGEQPFGLGLSISKKIIEKHGGKIWFTSEVDKGSVFYIELNKAY